MSALDITALIVAWIALLIIVGRDRIRDVLNDFRATPDRRDHIAECSKRERTAVEDLPAIDRLRSGAAVAEALLNQVLEIRSLPECESRRPRGVA